MCINIRISFGLTNNQFDHFAIQERNMKLQRIKLKGQPKRMISNGFLQNSIDKVPILHSAAYYLIRLQSQVP